MTTLTPPPLPDAAPTASAAPQPPRHRGARVTAIVAIVVGAVVLTGAAATGVARTIGSAAATVSETVTASVAGVTELDVDVAAVRLRVVFDDVDEAVLDVTDSRPGWGLERDDDELRVTGPSGWFGFGIGWFGDDGRAVLTLPRSLEGIDASLHVGAGELDAAGAFGELDVEVSAGGLTVTGSARSLSATVGAGDANLDLSGVTEAEFDVSAGDMDARLTGRAPREVQIDVSAGSLDLTLPDATYDVRADVSAGDVDNRLARTSSSGVLVDVRVSAGDVTLRSE